MSDLISRQEAIKEIISLPNCYNGYSDAYDKSCIIGVLEELPQIKPKKGEWYDWSFTAFDGCTVWHRVCSVCGYKRDDDNLDKDTNYCPNCGAKMEGSE